MTLYEVLELFLPEYFLGTDILYPMRSYPMRLEISSRKLRDTKGTFHANMGSIKDRNSMYLTEAEDIKK